MTMLMYVWPLEIANYESAAKEILTADPSSSSRKYEDQARRNPKARYPAVESEVSAMLLLEGSRHLHQAISPKAVNQAGFRCMAPLQILHTR